jgi:hypothetical protein
MAYTELISMLNAGHGNGIVAGYKVDVIQSAKWYKLMVYNAQGITEGISAQCFHHAKQKAVQTDYYPLLTCKLAYPTHFFSLCRRNLLLTIL